MEENFILCQKTNLNVYKKILLRTSLDNCVLYNLFSVYIPHVFLKVKKTEEHKCDIYRQNTIVSAIFAKLNCE